MQSFSIFREYGMGTSSPETRFTGAAREKKQPSWIRFNVGSPR
jgi:hypothetical protein